MKVILSRKGFDSQYGQQASPILPDGTLLSLPIPSNDNVTYSELTWNGLSYLDIIRSLNPKTSLNEMSRCHLDPDLRESIISRQNGWQPAFGQTSAALTELRDHEVSVGDLFLFFGWFKETEFHNGVLRYKPRAKDIHIIYGYLQVGRIIEEPHQIPKWLQCHPHASLVNYADAWHKQMNAIFLPSKRLSISQDLPGSGTFMYDKRLVLTKQGYSRSRWDLPETMRNIPISHNPNGWKEDYFQSATRGQEFVIPGEIPVMDWVRYLFNI